MAGLVVDGGALAAKVAGCGRGHLLATGQHPNKEHHFEKCMMATATERRFTSLRKRLDQLGFRQPLGVESLPLVEKLFGDLLHTTESLKSAKQQLGKHKEQKVYNIIKLDVLRPH